MPPMLRGIPWRDSVPAKNLTHKLKLWRQLTDRGGVNTNNNMAVAETILAQLNGNAFLAMTGAKNLLADANSLQMKLGRGCMNGITHLRVTLDASDTYTVTFLKVRGVNVSTVAEVSGVYAEDLRRVFTLHTGFATSL